MQEHKPKLDRRMFLKAGLLAAAGLALQASAGCLATPSEETASGAAKQPGSPAVLDPGTIAKFVTPLPIPGVMPRAKDESGERYAIAARQLEQQILPASHPKTTVWGYGAPEHPSTFHYPGPTIEARHGVPVRVQWINELVDDEGRALPHLLPVDQTLHWANPPGGEPDRNRAGTTPTPYEGPVPLVTHLHGGHVGEESDGHPESWYLPDVPDLPPGYAAVGSTYDAFRTRAEDVYDVKWTPGSATYLYPNDQAAATLWYHDHALGITRLNVYAGLSGFYLLRGGPGDAVLDERTGEPATLPGPAPAADDPPNRVYFEIPILIQDRSFNADGSLHYPASRTMGLEAWGGEIPTVPEVACDGQPSDIPPIWIPEFYGNTIVVNGATWPYLEVEARRYRFRFVNGSDSRTLILRMDDGTPFHQIGASGGFLPEPVQQEELLLAPAERADVIVDFSRIPAGTQITLLNRGPDGPFRGGRPGEDFAAADSATTGSVMQFRIVPATSMDASTPVEALLLPEPERPGPEAHTRQVSLNTVRSETVRVVRENERLVMACDARKAHPFSPTAHQLGTVNAQGYGEPLAYGDPISEKPVAGTTEVWEIHNFTTHAHPIHLHLATFEVVNRASFDGQVRDPEPAERGLKDTVIAYPSEITRIRAHFDLPGRYMWHCHMLGHEDNEMMRPFQVTSRGA